MSVSKFDTGDAPVSTPEDLEFTEYPLSPETGNPAIASTSGSSRNTFQPSIPVASTSYDEDCCYVGENQQTQGGKKRASASSILIKQFQFSANITTMFTDIPFMQRFQRAKECGFRHIEIQNPYLYNKDEIKAEILRTDMVIDMVNSYNGSHEMGCAAIPGCDLEFFSQLSKVLTYQFELSFKKVHIMTGMRLEEKFSYEDQRKTLIKNLKTMVEGETLGNYNIVAVLEPISPAVKEGYFLNDYKQAINIIEEVGSDQVKLLLDVYHLHNLTGQVSRYLPRYYNYAGHIQVSQSPGRELPFNEGEINYDAVFKYFRQQGYNGIIGLECASSGNAEDYSPYIEGCW